MAGDNVQISAVCPHCKPKFDEVEAMWKNQVKVNAELKSLLVGALGSDVGVMVESLTKDKLTLDRELNEIKSQVEKDTDNIDNLSAQADTWRSKYLALKIAMRDLMIWKTDAVQQLDVMHAALQEMLNDYDRLWAPTSNTYSVLSTLCKQSAGDICYVPEKPPHGSILNISEANQKLSRCLLTVFGKLPLPSLHDKLPTAEPSLAAKKAMSAISSCNRLKLSNRICSGNDKSHRDVMVERFHPSSRLESDGPILCRGCKGNVIVL